MEKDRTDWIRPYYAVLTAISIVILVLFVFQQQWGVPSQAIVFLILFDCIGSLVGMWVKRQTRLR